jgi:DNA-binding MarR family transcriptional regulator
MVADIAGPAQCPFAWGAALRARKQYAYTHFTRDDVCAMSQYLSKPTVAEQMLACTCRRLRKVTRRVTQIYDQALAPLDLTITQFGLLAYLAAYGEVSIGELAEESVMDPTTLTRTLQPLERRRLIRIATARDDRRRRNVTLTETGRATFRDAVPLWRKAGVQLGDVLGTRGRTALDQSLEAALQHLTGP